MTSWELFFVVFIGVGYVSLILGFYYGINRVVAFKSERQEPQTSFTVIIPFRNESKNLPSLLGSLAKINYPKKLFEVLLVNDDSSDDSVQLIQSFLKEYPSLPLRILQNEWNSASPKKDAITTAINQSQFDWILTTDADCILPKTWLQTYNTYIIENEPIFIAGLVSYQNKEGFLHQFQQFDWMSLVGVTIGSFGWQKPLLCSGANLGYSKQAFLKVDGFKGNDQVASGDDVFLLHKMQNAYSGKVSFLNAEEAIVTTKSESTWQALYHQRIRWAAKTSKIPNLFITFIGIQIALTNLLLLSLLSISLFIETAAFYLGIFFIIKLLVDWLLVEKAARILKQKVNFLFWLLSSIWYPFFSVSVLFISLFSSYTWKGRKFLK